MRNVSEINAMQPDVYSAVIDNASRSINCCLPAKIVSFDKDKQIASVKPLITRKVVKDGSEKQIQYPILTDVPVLFLGGGDFFLSFPVRQGDQCIVVFSDLCIDAWYQNGGLNGQVIGRHHDISDGFAIVGVRSMPNVIKNFNGEIPAIPNLIVNGTNLASWISWVNGKINSIT